MLILDCQKTKVTGVFLLVCAIFIIREMAPFGAMRITAFAPATGGSVCSATGIFVPAV
jgi:hypothetical protein